MELVCLEKEMHPDLFKIGSITIHTYGVFVALGIFSAISLAMRLANKEGIPPSIISDMCFWIIIWGIIGARFVYVLMNISYYIRFPLEILELWKGGLVFSGALISACLVAGVYVKKYSLNFWIIGDIIAPCASLGQAIGRIGCFMAGCCYGKSTNIPWAVTFHNPNSLAPLNIPLHPTQLYHFLACLIIFFCLMWLWKHKSFDGQVFLWYLLMHSLQRLIIERFRGDLQPVLGNMTLTQFISIVVLLTAGISIIVRKKHINK